MSGESEWTRGLCRDLEKLGAVTLALVAGGKSRGQMMQTPGWPDRYICHPLWMGWLEFKVDAPLTPLQAQRIRMLNERWPGCAYAVRQTNIGILVQNWKSESLLLSQNSARDLLRSLFQLQVKDAAWVEERQQLLGDIYRRLGDEC